MLDWGQALVPNDNASFVEQGLRDSGIVPRPFPGGSSITSCYFIVFDKNQKDTCLKTRTTRSWRGNSVSAVSGHYVWKSGNAMIERGWLCNCLGDLTSLANGA